MRSFGFLLSRRWVLFTLAVAALAWGTWWLGEWQHGRLEHTRRMNAVVASNLAANPRPVGTVMSPRTEVGSTTEWTRVTATGTYDTAHTLVWRYLTDNHSDSGVDEVVPLVTTDGMTLLVDRGWVPSSNPQVLPANAPQPPTGKVTVVGWVRQNASGDATVVADGGFRALDSTVVAPAIGKPAGAVYDGFVDLATENGARPAGLGQVDKPDPNQTWVHFFYWLQWWFFGLIAIFGYLFLMREDWVSARSEQASGGPRKARQNAQAEQKQRVKAAYQAAWAAEREAKERGGAGVQRARSAPPSTGTIAPVTNDAAGESRKAATRPNSAGRP